MKRIFFLLFALFLIYPFGSADPGKGKKWWQKWPRFPKGNRISAKQVKMLMREGANMVFVYSGYEGGEGDDIVCGSLIIPYDEVPPFGDGSRVGIRIPKDWWVICYCP